MKLFSPRLWRACVSSLFALFFIGAAAQPLADAITYVEAQANNVNGVAGLLGISDVAVSPDGKFVYTASYQSSAVSVFERNAETGELTYSSTMTGVSAAFSVDVSSDNASVYAASPTGSVVHAFTRDLTTGALTLVGSASGSPTGGFVSVSVSPDSKTVYGVGGSPSGLVVFSRDMETSAIARVADYADNANGYALGQMFGPEISPIKNIASTADGQFVYVTSTTDNAVTLFNRDATTGALTQLAVYSDGVAGVDGLQAASSVKTSPDGQHLYVTGQGESSVAIFGVDEISGELTYIDKVTNGVDGIANLQGARSLAISPDGRYVLVSAINSGSVTAFSRDAATGLLTFDSVAINAVDGVTGLASPSGMATDPLNRHLYVAGQGASSLVVFSLPTPAVKLSVNTATAVVSGPVVTLDPQLEVLDSDSPDLVSATIAINSGFINTDALAVQTVAGIAAAYDTSTGVLSLSGIAPLADYQAVLRSLSYQAGADPSLGTGDSSTRQISIQVSDGENTSAAVAITVTVEKPSGFIVTFVDWNNTLLSSQVVTAGAAATAPTNPSRPGYSFTGWDLTFNNVTTNLTVTAQYSINTYTVTATVMGDGIVTPATQQVQSGTKATLTLDLMRAGDYVLLDSNCNASLSGNQITTADITSDCAIRVTVYAATVATIQSDEALTVNKPNRFTITGGAGDKLLTEALLKRSGDETALNLVDANALVKLESDGSYLFSASRTGRYNLAYVDSVSGERVTVDFDVLPYIAFASSKQPVQQNTSTTFRVWLSDEPIEYPVVANFVATGSTLAVEQLELTADDSLRRTYEVTATAEVANIRLIQEGLTSALVGTPAVHTLAVQEQLPALALVASATQNGQQTSVVTTTDGDVVLKVAELNGIDASYTWSADGLVLTTNGASASFSTAAAPEGLYTVTIEASSLDGRIGQYDLVVRVIAECPLESCADTGTSGIPASVNPFTSTPNRIPVCPNVSEDPNRVSSCQTSDAATLYAEVPNQYTLALGALSGDQSWTTGQFGIAVDDQTLTDAGYNHLGVVVNFDVLGLEHPGEAVSILVPLPAGTKIPEHAVWRKYIDNQWQDFVVDDDNMLHSAAHNALGQCPGVSADTWTEGLVQDLDCVRLTIEDGGPNDADGVANNTIRDPGVLVVAMTPEPPVEPPVDPVAKDANVRSGGGSMGGSGLLLMGLLGLIRFRKLLAAMALLPLPALAQNIYLGVDGLAAKTSVNSSDVTGKIASSGITGTAQVEDNSRSGWRLYGGLEVSDALSLEVGWLDMGDIITQFHGIPETTSARQLVSMSPQSGEGLELGARWQVTDRFENLKPSLRAGIWLMDVKARYTDDMGRSHHHDSDTVPFIGADVQWTLTEQWSTKLGASRYYTQEYGTVTINLGLIYNF